MIDVVRSVAGAESASPHQICAGAPPLVGVTVLSALDVDSEHLFHVAGGSRDVGEAESKRTNTVR
jgi:hypothetical protein